MAPGSYLRSRWEFLRASLPERFAGVFVAAAIVVALLAAWFNDGFLNADEHYQIIEFAQYKLGVQPSTALAWEFSEHMRPALQPWVAAIVIRAQHQLGVMSPFAIARSMRLLTAVLGLWVSLELCVRTLRGVRSRWARQSALFLSFFLWIIPTVHARFSSENWGGLWYAAGLCLLWDATDDRRPRPGRSLMLAVGAGVVWGVAFYSRFQMAIAMAGAVAWLVLVRRRWALCLAIAAGFVAACGMNEILDRWLYGVWTFAPLNYVWMNLVLGKAAEFGTQPWWMVMIYAGAVLIPPFSFAILAMLAVGSWYGRRAVVVWSAVPFLFVHAVLARKDARFLIPLLYLLGPWFALSVDALPPALAATLDRWRRTMAARAGVAAFCAVNLAMLSLAIVLPGNDRARLDEWLWRQSRQPPLTIYEIDHHRSGLPDNVTNSFYASDVVVRPLVTGAAQTEPEVFIYYEGVTTPAVLARECRPVVRSYPTWLAQLRLFVRATNIRQASICRVDGSALPPSGGPLTHRDSN